mgnify:CR=1 FL=1
MPRLPGWPQKPLMVTNLSKLPKNETVSYSKIESWKYLCLLLRLTPVRVGRQILSFAVLRVAPRARAREVTHIWRRLMLVCRLAIRTTATSAQYCVLYKVSVLLLWLLLIDCISILDTQESSIVMIYLLFSYKSFGTTPCPRYSEVAFSVSQQIPTYPSLSCDGSSTSTLHCILLHELGVLRSILICQRLTNGSSSPLSRESTAKFRDLTAHGFQCESCITIP